MHRAFLNDETRFEGVVLGNEEYGYAELADVHWGSVNLLTVDWSSVKELGDERVARSPLADQLASPFDDLSFFKTAARANRQLAMALRNQGLNEQADRFAYRAQLCQRRLPRRQGIRKLPEYLWSLFLWIIAGYGYRVWRILAAYGTALVAFTFIYWALGVHSYHSEPSIQALWDSFLVSLSAIHGRTMFEQLGAWSSAAWVAAIESVIGIVIEGIFVAMLIQRFFAR